MSRVCIIGIGWLGLQLARKLKRQGYEVIGTVSSKEKQQQLSKEFGQVLEFNINEKGESELSQFKNVDYYILTIPPSATDRYAEKINKLIDKLFCETAAANLIYTSSSSVYGSIARNVSEESETLPETNNAKEIVKVEHHLLQHFENRSFILRLGGLVGKNRHPAKYLSGRNGLKKGKAPVNLVHAEDICNLIHFLIKKRPRNRIYNVCCHDHPTKSEYYTWAAKQLQLPIPKFNTFDNQLDKIVNSEAIKKINFDMNYKSPYDFPIAI